MIGVVALGDSGLGLGHPGLGVSFWGDWHTAPPEFGVRGGQGLTPMILTALSEVGVPLFL